MSASSGPRSCSTTVTSPARSRQLHCSEKTGEGFSNDGNVHPVIVHHRRHPVDHPLQLHPEGSTCAGVGRSEDALSATVFDVGKHSNHVLQAARLGSGPPIWNKDLSFCCLA